MISSFVISGNLTAHLSSLIHPDRKVFAFGVTQDSHEMIEDKLEKMAARSILFFLDTFLSSFHKRYNDLQR